MMERQISKKKLERLTICGGDFRKAGQRSSVKITIEDLRKLLEDDLNLQYTQKKDGGGGNGGGDWMGQEISAEELEMIMNREWLFGEEHVLDGYGSGEDDGEESQEQENIYEAITTTKKSKAKTSSSASKKGSKKRVHAEIADADEENNTTPQKKKKLIKTVPKEGIMYDIVNTNFGTELSLS
jgi:hypothetical protein